MNPTLFDEPPVRATDPQSSRDAAATAKAGNDDLLREIRAYVLNAAPRPVTAFDIADAVHESSRGRWQLDSIRSACVPKRGARLRFVDKQGVSPGGRKVQRWTL